MWFSKPSWFGSNCENDIEDDIGVSEGSKVILDNNDACQDTSSLFKTMMGNTISRKVSIFNRGLIAFVLLNKLFISNTLLYYKLNCAIMMNWIICSILYNLPLNCNSGNLTSHFFFFSKFQFPWKEMFAENFVLLWSKFARLVDSSGGLLLIRRFDSFFFKQPLKLWQHIIYLHLLIQPSCRLDLF